jgi:CheY-like chemotaxis protein
MIRPGQIVRCNASGAVSITRGKYYTVLAIKDGWATVVNDFGIETSYSLERFRPVDEETLADEGYLHANGSYHTATHPSLHLKRPPTSEFRGNGETILLVEDNSLLRGTTAVQLRNLNYIVIEAGDATQAMECLRASPAVALLFTDIVMPGGVNGFDLARACLTFRPDLKVLLTTGFALSRHGDIAAHHLGWPLLGKPYRIRELARHVSNLLKKTEGRATAPLAGEPN